MRCGGIFLPFCGTAEQAVHPFQPSGGDSGGSGSMGKTGRQKRLKLFLQSQLKKILFLRLRKQKAPFKKKLLRHKSLKKNLMSAHSPTLGQELDDALDSD